ncbi:hypothetical protein ACFRAR_30760 [Kitasatospora sp. NPDC056651]|uniref:hypothetical protein n=1 Tax=Kitasatospora sp. NPDC056651 TaxID=3345892 RepID=UPI0036894949
MVRIRARRVLGLPRVGPLVGPLAAGLLLVGAGAAAGDGSVADSGSVSDNGAGNVFGGIDGNHVSTQQTATGTGASNQDNTLAAKDNAGNVLAGQGDKNINVIFAPASH